MKKKKHFNKIEEKILTITYHHHLPYTIYEIAKECGISYPTSKKYVNQLLKQEILLKDKNSDKKYVFNYNLLKDEKKK